jgi:hypothetical protein
MDDLKAISKTSSTKAVSALKAIYPEAGKLYNWLSGHSHWAYSAHIKSWDVDDDKLGILLATGRFKAISLALAIVMLQVAIASFCLIKNLKLKSCFRLLMTT